MFKKEQFKERFLELVTPLALPKTKCAKEIGISYKTFNDICTTDKVPRIYTIIKIACYFKVSMDYLLGISDSKEIKMKIP